ncbi:MAG: hypothetical protein GY913_06360 [Proteobacteria bacterium]|nr:hypothetical protein [Pseudomonadota bacterium]MCP4916529.1 hypothetical protein [Pseudomonadota bacterium]
MFSLLAYKVVHLVGMFLVYMALGAAIFHSANGGTKDSNTQRKLVGISHGVGMFIILLGGFGMLARLGLTGGFPGWIWAKLAIWVLLGACLAFANKLPNLAKGLWFAMPVIGGVAAYIALYRPF